MENLPCLFCLTNVSKKKKCVVGFFFDCEFDRVFNRVQMIQKIFNRVFVDYDEGVIYIAFPDFSKYFKGFAIIPYYHGLTEKIWHCLSNHNVETVLKPLNIIGKKLAHHKDSVDPNMRQGAVYQIPCYDFQLLIHWQNKTLFFHLQKRTLSRHSAYTIR